MFSRQKQAQSSPVKRKRSSSPGPSRAAAETIEEISTAARKLDCYDADDLPTPMAKVVLFHLQFIRLLSSSTKFQETTCPPFDTKQGMCSYPTVKSTFDSSSLEFESEGTTSQFYSISYSHSRQSTKGDSSTITRFFSKT